jgi:DNA repair exonuclease SbcCD ATPase subunit
MKRIKRLYKEYEQLKKQYAKFLHLRDINKKQLGLYPRLRFVEDHDLPRVKRLIDDAHGLRATLRAIGNDIKRVKQEIAKEHRIQSCKREQADECARVLCKFVDNNDIYTALV